MISVIIPTYNRWKFLNRAIESVLNQTYKNIECVVVDDHSMELQYPQDENSTRTLFQDERIKWVRLPQNMRKKHNSPHAQGLTRNEGIKIAQGEFLAFLDDDDWWHPQKLEKQMNIMLSANIYMCCSNAISYFSEDRIDLFHKMKLPKILNKEDIERVNYIINSSVIVRKKLVESVGGFNLILYEDYDLWKRLMKYTKCLYIEEPLVVYDMNHGEGIFYDKITD